jgi:chemotaxis protein histidine kinase CheA
MSSSKSNTLTPEARRELDVIDAALAGAPVAAEHDSLARFATELRQVRPVADEQFLAALDAGAAEGFESGGEGKAPVGRAMLRLPLRDRPRRLRSGLRLRGLGARPALGLALAGLLAVAVVVPVALSGGSGGSAAIHAAAPPAGRAGAEEQAQLNSPGERAEAQVKGSAQRDKRAAQARAGASSVIAAPLTPTPSAASAPSRQVERMATLDVGVAPGAIDSKSHQVFTLVSSYGGYVRTSNVSSGGGQGGASFDIRVPSSKLATAISALSALGHVRSENNTTNDVTEQFDSLQHSLGDLRAERASLLKQIAQASEGAKAEELKARLRNVETVLARYERSLRALSNRINYTPLALTLTPEAGAGSSSSGELTPGSAAHDAGRILEAALAVLVIAAAALLPLGVVALAAWMIVASGRRRLREHALDAS